MKKDRWTPIVGLKALEDYLKNFGNMPQRVVTKSVDKAARLVLNAVKSNAPVDTGFLKQNLIMKPEKKKKNGRRIVRIRFKSAFYDQINSEHSKTDANRKRQQKRKNDNPFIYSAAMEYGYFIKGGKFIPGYGFMRKGLEQSKDAFEKRLFEELDKELDKLAGG